MIKYRALPIGGAVANRAIGGKTGGSMIGIRSLLERCHVAACALRRRGSKRTAGMALRALQSDVRSRQDELGHSVVIEG